MARIYANQDYFNRVTDASKIHRANNNARLLAKLTPETIHASCARRMKAFDLLSAPAREQIHHIGVAFESGLRIKKADIPPVYRTSKKNLAIQSRGARIAQRLGLKSHRVQVIYQGLSLEDLGL